MLTLHKLRPSTKILKDFYVFDLETGIRKPDGSIQWHLNARPESFIFGVVYGYNFQKVIHSREDFINEFKDERYKGKKVFAHNGGRYDYIILFDNVFLFDPKALFIGSRFICCTNGNCLFADSTNIFVGQSIEKIGEQLGIKKPSLGDENMLSKSLGPDEINRCVVDCQILWDALFSTFEFAGEIRITQAGLSLGYYRRYHQPFHIDFNENVKYFWDSYFGGRCEAFKIGKTSAVVIDRNSMYPKEMIDTKFPNPKYLKYELFCSVKRFTENILPHYEGCVYCTLEHSDYWLGFLPVKIDGKTMFPTGTFSGCWNFNEIKYAIDFGVVKIKSIKKIVYAERMNSPFISFVEFLYKERFRLNNDFEIDRVKRYINSLYGKFGQRIDNQMIYIEDIEKQFDLIQDYQKKNLFIELHLFNSKRKDAMMEVKSMKKTSVYNSIPSFASYITSAARVSLLKKLIELENNRPVYCDTDSVFYELETKPYSFSTKVLGEWKKEGKLVNAIFGLKNYRYKKIKVIDSILCSFTQASLKTFRRLKGVPEKRSMEIKENVFEFYTLSGVKESLRRNILPGVLTRREKTITGKYNKRVIEGDETKPIKI